MFYFIGRSAKKNVGSLGYNLWLKKSVCFELPLKDWGQYDFCD